MLSREIEAVAKELKLDQTVVELHASLRSLTPRVDGDSIIGTFLHLGTTLMIPAFSHICEVRPSEVVQQEVNGFSYGPPISCSKGVSYTPAHSHVDENMGVLPRLALKRGAERGGNPFNSFCAIGPHAFGLMRDQTAQETYGHIQSGAALGGKLLLIGLDLRVATCLHLAERMVGRKHYVRWFCREGAMESARVGSCSFAFGDFMEVIPHEAQMSVCGSVWSVYDLPIVLETAVDALKKNRYLGLCNRRSCLRCAIERARVDL